MSKQTKKQQIQFFKDVLLPQLKVPTDKIDIQALVDSKLTTWENWQEHIKPKAKRLVDRDFLTKRMFQTQLERNLVLENQQLRERIKELEKRLDGR